jgi:hypothetical protein
LSPSYGWEATYTLAEPVLVDKDRCRNARLGNAGRLRITPFVANDNKYLTYKVLLQYCGVVCAVHKPVA